MKKKLFIFLMLISMGFGLTACGRRTYIVDIDKVLKSPDPKLANFEIINNNFYSSILVDKNTGVMYYWINCDSGGITPIYNEDGSLKRYTEENDNESSK